MSKVEISHKKMQLARKSLKRMYTAQFGENSLSDAEKYFTRDDLILRYAKNLKFWDDHLPETQPGMSEFVLAKHAISSNAIEQLWKKVDEYDIRKETTQAVESLIKTSQQS